MKLFFRNFFIFTFVVLGLTTVGSQITSAQTGSSATPEQLAEINSRPEVYVKDLILDKTSYKAGDIVKGSFTLVNGKDISVSNLSYRAFLVADLIDDATYRYEFDNQVLGTLFLDKSEVKTVSFEYRLPLSSSAYTLDKQIGIKIRAFSGSGSPLGWSDTKISVTDTGITPVVIRNATVVVDGKSFLLNEGPMVYPSKKVALTLTVANTSDLDIINLTPVISVYEMDYAKDLLSTSSEKAFSLKAKSETKLNIDLPVFNYTPKVYAGELILVDQNGVTRANPIKFRYIVYGDVVNIQNVTLDKDSAKKGETVNAKLLYSGTPYDILTGAVATSTPLDLTVNLFNEKDELVATYSEKTNFVGLSTKDFDLVLMEKARAFKVQVQVVKEGKIITDYQTTLTGDLAKIKKMALISDIIWAVVIVLILLAVIILVARKKKALALSLVLIVMGLGMITHSAEAFTVTQSDGYDYGGTNTTPSVTVNSPSPSTVRTYTPGEAFTLTGSVTTSVCNNSDYFIKVYKSTDGVNWTLILNTGDQHEWCGGVREAWCPITVDFSSTGNTAPITPGTHRIYVKVESYKYFYRTASQIGYTIGYQDYTVTAISKTLSVTKSGTGSGTVTGTGINCGTDCSEVVNSGTVVTLTATSTSGSTFAGWSGGGCSGTGSTCVVTVTTNTAINAVFNLIPAVFSATCSVSPSSPTVNQVVTWSASASGGTSSYTYLWSNGASGTGTTATTSYSSIGTYHATVRVADGQSTSTIQCTGTVNGPGNNSGGNNNGVTVTSGLVNGVCGATPNLCSAGDSQDLPEDDTYYRWACKGINGGIDATPSCSSLIVGEENGDGSHISCSVTGPSSPQYVNTNTVWGVENVPLGYADYNKYWMVNGTLVSQPPSSSLTLNHIFTTVGVKNVSFYFSTSTGPIYCNNPGTTTTSIILPSGSVNEQ